MEALTKTDALFLQNTRKRVGKAIYDYRLIAPNDTVLVAVSGGKDSLFMLEALASFQKSAPFRFELKAIFVQMTDTKYQIDLNFLQHLCHQYQIPFYIRQTTLGNVNNSRKSPCFICSWRRRKVLFDATKELNCNKLALGHHLDDAIETLLMNMINHANISALPASVSMFKGAFHIIRPLLLVQEDNILKYAHIQHFPNELYLCPHQDKGHRIAMKQLISQMTKLNNNSKINLFRSMSNIDIDYLPKKVEDTNSWLLT